MQTVKKGIKRVAALAGSALMLGTTIAAPALSANLSDFPGMFVKDGELKATLVVGKIAATADVVGAINVALALAQAANKKAVISGGGAGTAKLSRTTVAGAMHEFALGAAGKGTGDERTDICFGDFKKGFLEETATLLEGLHDYHGIPFLQDVMVSPASNSDDKFRVFDIITFDTTNVATVGFAIDKDKLRFVVPGSALKYKIFIEGPTDSNYDLDTVDGNDNINDYANYTVSGKGDSTTKLGLGVDNYLKFKMFGSDVRLYDFDVDTTTATKFVILMGEKKVIAKGKTTEYRGYKVTLNDVASGSNTAFFEIVDPSGQTSMFSPNYDDVHGTSAKEEVKKTIGEFTISIQADTWNSLSTAEVWLGIGDIKRSISGSAKWKDNQNKETDWQLKNICCENKGTDSNPATGATANAALDVRGSSTCSTYADLGTADGRTCMIEYIYTKAKTGTDGLTANQYIGAPNDVWKLQFHGLNVAESAMGSMKVKWYTGETIPYDKSGDNTISSDGYKIIKPEGATLLLDNKQPAEEIFVAMPTSEIAAAAGGVNGAAGCLKGANKNQVTTDTSTNWAAGAETESDPRRPDTGCVFIVYKDEGSSDYKFYKALEDFTGNAFDATNSNMPAAALLNTGAAGEDGPAVRLLAKMYHGNAIYQFGITKVESGAAVLTTDNAAADEGTLYIASEEQGDALVQFALTFDFCDTSVDSDGFQDLYPYLAASGKSTSIAKQDEDMLGEFGIISKTPRASIDNDDATFKIAPKDVRGMVSLNSGVSTEEKSLKKGDAVGEYTVADIIPDVPTGDYYTFSHISVPVAMLDSEVSTPGNAMYGDFVLFGGPSANELVSQLGYTKWDFCDDADEALPCDAPIALIELKEDAFATGKKALVVAGWEAIHTRAACYILQHYYDYGDKLVGSRLKFKTAASVSLPIEAADISFA